MKKVLDSSVLLLHVFTNLPEDQCHFLFTQASMHTVSWAEFLSELQQRGLSPDEALNRLEETSLLQLLTIDPGRPEDALEVARLASTGLSFGARYCLALAYRQKANAITTATSWDVPDKFKVTVFPDGLSGVSQ